MLSENIQSLLTSLVILGIFLLLFRLIIRSKTILSLFLTWYKIIIIALIVILLAIVPSLISLFVEQEVWSGHIGSIYFQELVSSLILATPVLFIWYSLDMLTSKLKENIDRFSLPDTSSRNSDKRITVIKSDIR